MSAHAAAGHAGPGPRVERPLLLAFATRDAAGLRRLRSYLAAAFPRSDATWLVPQGFVRDLEPLRGPGCSRVLAYRAGGPRSWPGKMRIVRGLRAARYDYCAFPQDFCYRLRLDAVAILPLLVRARRLLVLAPDRGGARSLGKEGFLALYARTYLAFHGRRVLDRIRRIHTRRFEQWVRDRADPLAFLLLAGVAHLLRAARRPPPAGRPGGEGSRGPSAAAAGVPDVAFFVSNLDMGGTQRQLQTLLERSQGLFRPSRLLVYVPAEGPFPERFAGAGVPILTLSPSAEATEAAAGRERFLRYNFPVTATVLHLCRLLRPLRGTRTILHCFEFKANVLGAVAGGLAGVPAVVSSVRNLSLWKTLWDGTWWYRPADILTARLNDRILANADAVRRDYGRWARVPQERIRVLYNGLDPEDMRARGPAEGEGARRALGWGPRHALVGWAGRMAPQKDPAAFAEVARALHAAEPSVRFVLLGDGPLAGGLRRSFRESGMDHAVRFLGARTDAYRWMRALDVLVMTSIIEGMPNVLIEAMFLGVPPVTTDAGGAGEVVEDGVTGYVVPVGAVRSLAARTLELLRDPLLRQRFARAGRLRAEARFHADRMVRETARLYRELAAPAGGSRRNPAPGGTAGKGGKNP